MSCRLKVGALVLELIWPVSCNVNTHYQNPFATETTRLRKFKIIKVRVMTGDFHLF